MGCNCSRNAVQTQPGVTSPEAANSLFAGPYNAGKGFPQILLLGPSGSGKTTLLYSTMIPEWKNISTEIVPTVTFHYEEIVRGSTTFGVWDISGSEAIQNIWPHLYEMVCFDVVIYIVSILEQDFLSSKYWLRRLVSDVSLQHAYIIVVINRFGQTGEDTQAAINHVITGLELEDVKSLINNGIRFGWYVVNVSEGESDETWASILNWIVTIVKK